MDYQKLCSDIIGIDPKIRVASVYNNWAEKLGGAIQKDLTIFLPEKLTQDSINQAILRWQYRKGMMEWIGRAKYAMSEYEKIKRFTFYLNESDLLLVTTESDADHGLIIPEIQKLIAA